MPRLGDVGETFLPCPRSTRASLIHLQAATLMMNKAKEGRARGWRASYSTVKATRKGEAVVMLETKSIPMISSSGSGLSRVLL